MTSAELAAAWRSAEAELGAPLTEETLAAMRASLDSTREKYDEGVKELDRKTGEADRKFYEAENKLRDAEKKLTDGRNTYNEKLADYEKALADAQEEFADAERRLSEGQDEIDEAAEKLEELKRPSLYVLDRSSNIGYACFENDTAIVSGVAKVFPVFFFMVAALVCITTMTRMVGEQRTENGVLKALGYGDGMIGAQYLFYAGSASAIGCFCGFLLGSKFLPLALWQVYNILYSIEKPLVFTLDVKLFVFCSALYLVCALGATWFVCRRDLKESSAQLMRPKAPAAGKRILLERIDFVWKRIKFLNKVSIRNIVRYKKRMVMMILGIGGCTALLLTGFGIRDTIQPVVGYQFDEITIYDAVVTFTEGLTETEKAEFSAEAASVVTDIVFLHAETADISTDEGSGSVNLIVFDEKPDVFVDLHRNNKAVEWPQKGEAVINYRFANEYGVSVGDRIELVDGDYNALPVTVSGIFDNYIYDYVYVRADTYEDCMGHAPELGTAYVKFSEASDVHEAGAELLSIETTAAVTISEDLVERVGSMLESLDYIVLIVLVCAGALAFIVLYNLTNITIIERTREIATLKVLGFYINEQNSYVFRENLVLTGISALFGIPMGLGLLYYVMAQIKLDNMYFGCRVEPLSYLLAVLLTFVFTLAVDAALIPKTGHINMAEAMKAVE